MNDGYYRMLETISVINDSQQFTFFCDEIYSVEEIQNAGLSLFMLFMQKKVELCEDHLYDLKRREEGRRNERLRIIRNLVSLECDDEFIEVALGISKRELEEYKEVISNEDHSV